MALGLAVICSLPLLVAGDLYLHQPFKFCPYNAFLLHLIHCKPNV
nr:MAG TPA: hypothetical protein [Caudoviricetes sp.]